MYRIAFFSTAVLLAAVVAYFIATGSQGVARYAHTAPKGDIASQRDNYPSLQEVDVRSPRFRARKLEALGGSVEAADELLAIAGSCSTMGVRSKAERDRCDDVATFWFDVALQNGSAAAAQRRTIFLLYSDKCWDIHRAEYWYGRHASAYAGDKDLLKSERAEIDEKKKTCSW